ncbi:FAD:protein FMN transferase [Sphingomonas abietis]|uniref:FAD:protein FMN transferase n=1 Tax=Sphingomonas abietis TaxID=3012344 RepID=A0ABY7NM10_9SPHN|nr:FAD:protein FMN transferase [Sphingomonas abietis]WBO22553.1 FAD:protein FMN transferase [Sphingomonas abietis]
MRIALPPTISIAAFADRDASATVETIGGETMGTGWSVHYVRPPIADPAALRASIVARLDDLVAQLSQWVEDSHLSRFNRAAAGTWLTLPRDFAHVVAHGLTIARASGGAFDPTIGDIVNLWGFGPVPAARPPAADRVAAALASAGWHRLVFDPAGPRLRQPGGLALDFSGIGKGHAVDAVSELLSASGIRHHLVEIGGELAGRGVRPDGDPWWVDLENPPGAALPPLRIALHGLAVATSGNYRRGDHTIEPRTGLPTIDTLSVSVIHDRALDADAWATALTVLDTENALAMAATHGIAARIVRLAGGVAEESMSPALAAMLAD